MTFKTEINNIIESLITVSERFFGYETDKKTAVDDLRGAALEQRLAELDRGLKAGVRPSDVNMNAAVDRMIEEVKAGNVYNVNDASIANLLCFFLIRV